MGVIMKNSDKKITSLYITLLATIYNMTGFIHKTYVFNLIDYFGIYYPQIGLSIITFILLLKIRKSILDLDN
jgi:hypothetical protein